MILFFVLTAVSFSLFGFIIASGVEFRTAELIPCWSFRR